MAKQKQLVDRITARDEAGNTFEMVQYQTMISSTDIGTARTQWAKGTTEWFLVKGGRQVDVNTDDDVHFETLDGLKLTKVD